MQAQAPIKIWVLRPNERSRAKHGSQRLKTKRQQCTHIADVAIAIRRIKIGVCTWMSSEVVKIRNLAAIRDFGADFRLLSGVALKDLFVSCRRHCGNG